MLKLATIITLVGALVVSAARVEAGPWCGRQWWFSPASKADRVDRWHMAHPREPVPESLTETTVPVGATVALFVEDAYHGGGRLRRAEDLAWAYGDIDGKRAPPPPRVRATIDGKRVATRVRKVRTADGELHLVTIKSKRTGMLHLVTTHPFGGEIEGTYRIDPAWQAPDPRYVSTQHFVDNRAMPYRWVGHLAALRIEGDAIAFRVRWRRDEDSPWRQHWVSTTEIDERSAALLGKVMCGMTENVPLAFLERGVEVEVHVLFADGRERRVADVPNPFTIPPAPAKPSRGPANPRGTSVAP